jgi:hypothetical protein
MDHIVRLWNQLQALTYADGDGITSEESSLNGPGFHCNQAFRTQRPRDTNPSMALNIPTHWQALNNPSKIETSRFITQQITRGDRYIDEDELENYIKNRWPWAASVIEIKVCSLTPKQSSFTNTSWPAT